MGEVEGEEPYISKGMYEGKPGGNLSDDASSRKCCDDNPTRKHYAGQETCEDKLVKNVFDDAPTGRCCDDAPVNNKEKPFFNGDENGVFDTDDKEPDVEDKEKDFK